MRASVLCLAASLIPVLAGCGSGSGGSSPTPPAVTSTTPANAATGVAVTSTVTATFSEAMNASSITTSSFTLATQGGTAVSGSVSYSSATNSATFTPAASLSSNTQYTATITTGATSSAGTALSAVYTWSFTTVAGPAPTVTAFTPNNGATGVSVNTTATATFSEAMNASTITSSTFTLTAPGGIAVAGAVTYDSTNLTSTFTPSSALSYSTTYTAAVTTGVVGSDGTALASNLSWSFTTSGPPAPTVTAVTPANLSTGVAVSTTVTATFSEALNTSTITGSTFTLVPQGGTAVAASYSFNDDAVTLTPMALLSYNTTYTATLTTGVTAANGIALAENYTWSFTTAITPPPSVSAVTPANAGTDIALNTTVTATFSQVMTSATINFSTFTLATQGGTAVTGAVSYNSTTSVATFTPSQNLSYDTTYVATVTTGATSSSGIPLAQNYSWSFTTTTAPVPTVTATVPASGATNVIATNALTATFSQPMNSSTLTASTFTLNVTGGAAVTGTVTYSSGTQTATFTPGSTLAYSTSYTATITTGAASAAGAALASNYVWTFTTGTAPAATTVDFGTTEQTIRGFGGSTAWLGPLTTQQATALFSQTNGLGLSILRVRIDPEGSLTGGGAFGDPYETGEWDAELTNGEEAVAANPNAIVFATPWTPPASMKSSDTSQPYYSGACSPSAPPGESYCGGYLPSANYAEYATYLEDFVNFFDSNAGGINLYAISMQNEPEENVDYESCLWTPDQMDAFVESLTTGGATDPITTNFMMPESAVFNFAYSNPTLDDSSAVGNVAIIGGHLYSTGESTNTPSPYPLAVSLDKDVWATEHYLCPVSGGCNGSSQPTIADALNAAEEVHNTLAGASYNAYVWWWIWDDPDDGINYGLINSSTTSPAPTYYGYAIGQFSDFIQPGFVRVSATATPATGVYLSAYDYTGAISYPYHYVIVAINSNTSVQPLSFTLSNGNVTSLTPYQTTSAGGLAPQSAVTVTSGQFTYALPAQSITTFVQ